MEAYDGFVESDIILLRLIGSAFGRSAVVEFVFISRAICSRWFLTGIFGMLTGHS